jgi:hypothetical protein
VSLPGSSGVPERQGTIPDVWMSKHPPLTWGSCRYQREVSTNHQVSSPLSVLREPHSFFTGCWHLSLHNSDVEAEIMDLNLKNNNRSKVSEFKLKDQNGARILWPSGDRADCYGYCHRMHAINWEWFCKVGINASLRDWNPGITYRGQGSWTFLWVPPEQVQISHLGNVASRAYSLCLFTIALNHVCEKGTARTILSAVLVLNPGSFTSGALLLETCLQHLWF